MPTWTLHTEFKFDAAHFIEGYDGKCGRMHGHSYKVKISAKSNKLNPSAYLKTDDMVCDFKELKWAAKDADKGGLDHGFLNDLIEANTTAERIAEFIHTETTKRIPTGIDLKVIVWETETCWVEYTDKDE
ncbi:MAG: 6-carboxytetrahydropterin synthase [Balneola sp.]|nr:6-carboxytetrahydropterin synthase [Balneola sp.]MBO6651542.1 6-carboxytetrahydropterin synthase [Balneola sp.]MBO6710895.1 6-carboxytetrahydropterin synthase [Balneola sp.]MBO6799582.1 6-carboxytetrahydropterin synthase [Balneola sp.]MBO6870314.1 6-carboxytetrahydropterin synthase [Balneola sp.]